MPGARWLRSYPRNDHWEWDRSENTRENQSFDDFGFYNLTDLTVMVWF